MADKNRLKMRREDRAKQFAPFAALKGFDEALRAKEKIIVEKPRLSEEERDELDRNLHTIERGNLVKVNYYEDDECLEMTGVLSKVDMDAGYIKVVNKKLAFSDVYHLEVGKNKYQKTRRKKQ